MQTTARLLQVIDTARDIKTFILEPVPGFTFLPGQYVWLSLPGVGRSPMAIASGTNDENLQFTVRAWGDFTKSLLTKGPGDAVDIEGPHGTHFPMERLNEGVPVYLVGGGTGITPIRSLLRSAAPGDNRHVFFGARDPMSLLYAAEHPTWPAMMHLTVDAPVLGWTGAVGTVVDLLTTCDIASDAIAFVCGPKAMMLACVTHLRQRGMSDANIYVSLERFDAAGNVVGPVYPVSEAAVGI